MYAGCVCVRASGLMHVDELTLGHVTLIPCSNKQIWQAGVGCCGRRKPSVMEKEKEVCVLHIRLVSLLMIVISKMSSVWRHYSSLGGKKQNHFNPLEYFRTPWTRSVSCSKAVLKCWRGLLWGSGNSCSVARWQPIRDVNDATSLCHCHVLLCSSWTLKGLVESSLFRQVCAERLRCSGLTCHQSSIYRQI